MKTVSKTFFLSVLILVAHYVALSRGFYFIGPNPTSKVIESAISIAENGSFSAPRYYTLMEEVRKASETIDGLVWQDIASLGRNGVLLPKHSIISPIIAAPFFWLFGFGGLYLAHFLTVLALLLSLIALYRELFGSRPSFVVLIFALLAMNPGIFFELGIYGYDIQIATFIIAGIALSSRLPVFGSGLIALTVFIRPSCILLYLPIQILLLFIGNVREITISFSRLRDVMSGTLTVYLGYMLVMWILYGTPFTTPYHNLPEFYHGVMGVSEHPSGGDLPTLFSDLYAKIFGENRGLIFHAPVLLLFFLPLVVKGINGCIRLAVSSCAVLSLIYVYSYSMWDLVVPRIFYPIALILSLFVVGYFETKLRAPRSWKAL